MSHRQSEAFDERRAAANVGPRPQREVLRDVMLSAGECETWLTLAELARTTGYPPASISAQLRHLRKEQFGGYRLEKRCRASCGRAAGVEGLFGKGGPEWEYRINRGRKAERRRGQKIAPRTAASADIG